MMRQGSRVSVVIPTYQRAALLGETLAMLRAQTRQPFEIIIADDGSTDGTDALIAGLDDERIAYLKSDHLGMPGNLNKGLQAVRGDYVMICHDHDIYVPTMLEKLAGVLDRHPSALFAHSGIIGVDPAGLRETSWFVRSHAELTDGRRFLAEQMLPGLHSPVAALAMIRTSAVEGRWLDPRFRGCADVELWLRLCAKGDTAYVAEPLIYVRERDASSAFYSGACELAALVLQAKSEYLHLVDDPAARAAISRRWRREVDRTALLQMLQQRSPGSVDEPRAFVRRSGTIAGAASIALLVWVPAPVSLTALRAARAVWRALRLLSPEDRRVRGIGAARAFPTRETSST